MTKPTLDDIVAKVRELADENPDYVYQYPLEDSDLCVNWVTDDNGVAVGSCIIGKALIDLGVNAGLIPETAGAQTVLKALGYDTDDGRVRWLGIVQLFQDGQRSWGVARECADKVQVFLDSMTES